MAVYSEYFNRPDDSRPSPGLKSPPSTRPFTALALVTSIRYQGMIKIIQDLKAPVTAIRELAEKLESAADIEIAHRPDTGILCFRIIPEGFSEDKLNELQEYIFERIMSGGKRTISITKLDDKTVLRLVTVTPKVTSQSLMETVFETQELAQEYIHSQENG